MNERNIAKWGLLFPVLFYFLTMIIWALVDIGNSDSFDYNFGLALVIYSIGCLIFMFVVLSKVIIQSFRAATVLFYVANFLFWFGMGTDFMFEYYTSLGFVLSMIGMILYIPGLIFYIVQMRKLNKSTQYSQLNQSNNPIDPYRPQNYQQNPQLSPQQPSIYQTLPQTQPYQPQRYAGQPIHSQKQPLPQTTKGNRFCVGCGLELTQGEIFCPNCGNRN